MLRLGAKKQLNVRHGHGHGHSTLSELSVDCYRMGKAIVKKERVVAWG
ncbi:hypothetical protein [Coleofasciculus sp.]|jgi:hypothetical protein